MYDKYLEDIEKHNKVFIDKDNLWDSKFEDENNATWYRAEDIIKAINQG